MHGSQAFLRERPPHDGVDIAGQHPARVLEGLLAAQLGAPTVDDDGVTTELGDAHFKREPRAGGVLLEDDGHAARSLQRARTERCLLEFGCQREDFGLLRGRQIVVAQEVPNGHDITAASKMPGSALRKSSIWRR